MSESAGSKKINRQKNNQRTILLPWTNISCPKLSKSHGTRPCENGPTFLTLKKSVAVLSTSNGQRFSHHLKSVQKRKVQTAVQAWITLTWENWTSASKLWLMKVIRIRFKRLLKSPTAMNHFRSPVGLKMKIKRIANLQNLLRLRRSLPDPRCLFTLRMSRLAYRKKTL